MSCPNCNLKMIIVFFKYENEKVTPDGKRRLLCENCGYQEFIEQIKNGVLSKNGNNTIS